MVTDLERSTKVVEDGLRQLGCLVWLTDTGLNQGELVASQSCQAAEPSAVGAQAVGNGDQQAIARLVAELLVDFLEVVQPAAQYGNPPLAPAGVAEDTAELLLQHAAIGQAGQVVMLGHVQQVCFGFASTIAVAFDGFQQFVGLVDPQAEFVPFLAWQHRNMHLARMVGVNVTDPINDARQWFGQQKVIKQVERQRHRHRSQYAGYKDDEGALQEIFAVGRGVQDDSQIAVILVVGLSAKQGDAVMLLDAE